MRARIRTLALVMVGLLCLTPVQAQLDNPDVSTPSSLYFHIFDPFAKFVINTQPYNASFFDVGGVVFPSNPLNGWDFNTVYGYSTAGPVEYDFIEGGKPRFHPERGIAADIRIDESVQPMVYLYVDIRGVEGGNEHPPAHLPMTFRVQVREGDDPGSNFNDGQLIMDGEFTAYMVSPRWCPLHTANVATGGFVYFINGCGVAMVDPVHGSSVAGNDVPGTGTYGPVPTSAPDGTPILYADGNNVVEIAIPLDVANGGIIPKNEAYNVRLDWYQELGGLADEDEYQINNLRLVLGEEYLPRMEMNVLNPVYIEFIHPQVAAGTLLIHTGVNSPWGTYDVDVDNIKLTVDGPTQPVALERVVAQNAHVHGLHDKAAELTYLWKFRDENAPDGDYTITMEVPNLHGTATASGTAGFTIQGKQAFGVDNTGEVVPATTGNESKGSPAPAFGALALLAAAFALRRRSE